MFRIQSVIVPLVIGLACGSLWPCSPEIHAQDRGNSPRPKELSPKDSRPKELNPKEEAQTLAFANLHHPELVQLLESLKGVNPQEHQRAMQDLHRAQQRLARLEDKDPPRFRLELPLWKIESRIRLRLAQMTMENDAALEESLKPLLTQRLELKRDVLQFERTRVADRLVRIDRQLEKLQSNPGDYASQELSRLKQTLAKQAKPGKNKARQKARNVEKRVQKEETRQRKQIEDEAHN